MILVRSERWGDYFGSNGSEHEIGKLMVELSKCRILNVGVPRGSSWRIALEQAESLRSGIHPLRIAEGYEMAAKVATKELARISEKFEFDAQNIEPLIQTCMTTLSSKIVNRCKRRWLRFASRL